MQFSYLLFVGVCCKVRKIKFKISSLAECEHSKLPIQPDSSAQTDVYIQGKKPPNLILALEGSMNLQNTFDCTFYPIGQ